MVKYNRLDQAFGALADPIRRDVVHRLTGGEATVSELAAGHRVSLPAFLKHVRVLESAGLVRTRKVGRSRTCRLVPEPLAAAETWIEQHRAFWNRQLDSLERHLDDHPHQEASWPPPSAPPLPPSKSGAPSLRRPSASTKRGPTRKR